MYGIAREKDDFKRERQMTEREPDDRKRESDDRKRESQMIEREGLTAREREKKTNLSNRDRVELAAVFQLHVLSSPGQLLPASDIGIHSFRSNWILV